MRKAIHTIFQSCLNLKETESLLIIFDKKTKEIAEAFKITAKNYTHKIKAQEIAIPKVHGEEPPKETSELMKKYDTQLLITTKSLSHTQARKSASNLGKRIISMPGITKDIIKRSINIDYQKMNEINQKLKNILDKSQKVKIIKENHTLEFSIKKRHAKIDSGLFKEPKDFGNLPAGETFIAPKEHTATGSYIVDASMAAVNKLEEPLVFEVKEGFVKNIKGKQSKDLLSLLKSKKSKNIAEFGIGTNPKAKIIGNTLEDEKVKNTCHIALGNNTGFGGHTDVPIHLDGIIKQPTIYIDKKKIMEKGNLLI